MTLSPKEPKVRQWLESQEPSDRRLMLMWLADKLTAAEMAAVTGKSVPEVRTRIYELTAALQEHLQEAA